MTVRRLGHAGLSGELGQDACASSCRLVGVLSASALAAAWRRPRDWCQEVVCLHVWMQAPRGQEPVELGCLSSRGLVRWLDDSQHAGETDQPKGLGAV